MQVPEEAARPNVATSRSSLFSSLLEPATCCRHSDQLLSAGGREATRLVWRRRWGRFLNDASQDRMPSHAQILSLCIACHTQHTHTTHRDQTPNTRQEQQNKECRTSIERALYHATVARNVAGRCSDFLPVSAVSNALLRLSQFASMCGCEYGVAAANGTIAINLALHGIGMRRLVGDEIIVPSMTYVATAAAVVDAGGVPVFCDCDEYGLIDPKAVRRSRLPRDLPFARPSLPLHRRIALSFPRPRKLPKPSALTTSLTPPLAG